MTERNISLIVAYDGTDFSGWQRQGSGRSVQEDIELALEMARDGAPTGPSG